MIENEIMDKELLMITYPTPCFLNSSVYILAPCTETPIQRCLAKAFEIEHHKGNVWKHYALSTQTRAILRPRKDVTRCNLCVTAQPKFQ
jgi:hypothetical protein